MNIKMSVFILSVFAMNTYTMYHNAVPHAQENNGIHNDEDIHTLQETIEDLQRDNNLLRERGAAAFGEPQEKLRRFLDIFRDESPSGPDIEVHIKAIFGGIHSFQQLMYSCIQYNHEVSKIEDIVDRLSAQQYGRLEKGLLDLKKHLRTSKKMKRSIDSLDYIIYAFDYVSGKATFLDAMWWSSGEAKFFTLFGLSGVGFIGFMTYAIVKAVQLEQQKLEAKKKKKEEENKENAGLPSGELA